MSFIQKEKRKKKIQANVHKLKQLVAKASSLSLLFLLIPLFSPYLVLNYER